MRIVFLVNSMNRGGAERVGSLLCNHWAQKGETVTLIVTYSAASAELGYVLHEDVDVRFLSDQVNSSQKTPLSLLRRLLALRRLIVDAEPDLVISFLTQVNVAAIIATIGLKIPIVVSERTYPPSVPMSLKWRAGRRLTYQRAQRVVMQTQEGLEWLKHAIPKANGTVIANPINVPVQSAPPIVQTQDWIPDRRRLILAVGRMGPEKRFGRLLQAFAELCAEQDDLHLAILGDGPDRDALTADVARLKISARVSMPGWVGNLQNWYERADMFVLTSAFEGFPNVLLEALANGLPVLSTDCRTGPREIIEAAGSGHLIPVDSGPEEMGAGLREVLTLPRSPDVAARVRSLYSIDMLADAWLSAGRA